MNMYHQPWELVPNHIRGKGGREIDLFRGVSAAMDTDWGSEAWIGSTTHVGNPPADQPYYGCSEVILPNGERKYLFEAIAQAPEEILGKEHLDTIGQGVGVLIKYLDAQKQYGLQCHPTRAWAKKMWNSDYGKEESWYVIGTRKDTAEPAYILLGFKEGVTREMWENAYYADDLNALENMCHKIQVKVGEAYFVGGGCPHALGEGCFVIEVQEPADITLGAHPFHAIPEQYRGTQDEALFNERLLGSYIYDGCDEQENFRHWRIARKCIRKGDWGEESIVVGPDQTSYFSFTELSVDGATKIRKTGHPQVAIVLEGEGVLTWHGGQMPISQAKEIFFPVDVPELAVQGKVKLVLCNPEGVKF